MRWVDEPDYGFSYDADNLTPEQQELIDAIDRSRADNIRVVCVDDDTLTAMIDGLGATESRRVFM